MGPRRRWCRVVASKVVAMSNEAEADQWRVRAVADAMEAELREARTRADDEERARQVLKQNAMDAGQRMAELEERAASAEWQRAAVPKNFEVMRAERDAAVAARIEGENIRDALRDERDELLGQRAVQIDQAVIAELAAEERGRIDEFVKIVAEQSDAITKLEGLLEEGDERTHEVLREIAGLREGLEHALESEGCARAKRDELQGRVDRALEMLRQVWNGRYREQVIEILEPDPPLRPENFEALQEAFEERAAARYIDRVQREQREASGAPEIVTEGTWAKDQGMAKVGEFKSFGWTDKQSPDAVPWDGSPETPSEFSRSVRQHADDRLAEYVDHRMTQRVVRDFARHAARWGQYLNRHE